MQYNTVKCAQARNTIILTVMIINENDNYSIDDNNNDNNDNNDDNNNSNNVLEIMITSWYIGAANVTSRPLDQQTDIRGHREVTLSIIII